MMLTAELAEKIEIDDLVERLRAGVPIKTVRWPGNDGETHSPELAEANTTMAEAADQIVMLKNQIRAINAGRYGDMGAHDGRDS